MTITTRGRVRIEDTAKRIRNQIGGVTIADSTTVKLVWEIPHFPTYYFPPSDVRFDLLSDSGDIKRSPSRGTAALHHATVGDRSAQHAARVWTDSKFDEIEGYVSFTWAAMDAWFEEDEEVFVHARDPYTRIDILQSSRSITVQIDGVVVATSNQPRLLFETGLPTRYYLPKTDIHFQYLTPSDTSTSCPYKGTARYWSVNTTGETHEDVAWGYDAPIRESVAIAGYVAFYNEKVDICVDGVLEKRPDTKFG